MILAGLGLVACAALLLRFALPERQQRRLDHWAVSTWQSLRRLPSRPSRQRDVQRQAQDVIERARRQAKATRKVERDGNVYRPDSFKSRPPKQDKLH